METAVIFFCFAFLSDKLIQKTVWVFFVITIYFLWYELSLQWKIVSSIQDLFLLQMQIEQFQNYLNVSSST